MKKYNINITIEEEVPQPIKSKKPTITMFIACRQMGKTSRALERFMENPLNTIFITHNRYMARIITERLRKEWGYDSNLTIDPNVKSANQKLVYSDIKDKTVICDEYLFWTASQKEYFYRLAIDRVSIYVYSSLDKYYDLYPETYLEKKIAKKAREEDPYNLIYNDNVKIIKIPNYWKHSPSIDTHEEYKRRKIEMGDRFDLEFGNESRLKPDKIDAVEELNKILVEELFKAK